MSVEQMAMDLKNNIEELTEELFNRYCTGDVSQRALNADLTFCCGYGE